MRHDKRPHKTTAFLILLALFLATGNALAQTSRIPCRTEAECQALKQAMAEQSAIQVPRMEEWPSEPLPLPGQLRGGGGVCSLWEDPVGCPLSQGPNDDGSSPYIPLPFTFNLYGQLYNGLWINNNGNVTFDQPYGTFTATPFPNNLFVMIAPFWADVDTRGIGEVFYCVTPTAIYVNWVEVGYYNSQTNLTNSFQLVLTDGNDPVIGIGNNVAISYLDMQWTTGAASGGVGGFGGSPAVVGANLGNGTSFIQLGQFDQPGNAYDGPFGANDGVDWLDFKDFVFSTVNPNANVPPIIGGTTTCDSIVLCAGQSETLEIAFVSPEPNQITTASISSATFSNYTITSNVPGQTALMSVNVTPTVADVGFHQLELTGTDDGTPAETTTLTVVLNVLPPGVVIPRNNWTSVRPAIRWTCSPCSRGTRRPEAPGPTPTGTPTAVCSILQRSGWQLLLFGRQRQSLSLLRLGGRIHLRSAGRRPERDRDLLLGGPHGGPVHAAWGHS